MLSQIPNSSPCHTMNTQPCASFLRAKSHEGISLHNPPSYLPRIRLCLRCPCQHRAWLPRVTQGHLLHNPLAAECCMPSALQLQVRRSLHSSARDGWIQRNQHCLVPLEQRRGPACLMHVGGVGSHGCQSQDLPGISSARGQRLWAETSSRTGTKACQGRLELWGHLQIQ